MKRTTKYINQFRPPNNTQPDLFDQGEKQIREHHLARLRLLKEEFKVKAEEGKRKDRLTMLGER